MKHRRNHRMSGLKAGRLKSFTAGVMADCMMNVDVFS